jgi:hypothetical protein
MWSYERIFAEFGSGGCSVDGCPYNGFEGNRCALNLSDSIIRAGYTLPLDGVAEVRTCPHTDPRVRNADGMARVLQRALGAPDASGWANRPNWKGFVYFEDAPEFTEASGHVDLWDGAAGVHGTYDRAKVIWFWRLSD